MIVADKQYINIKQQEKKEDSIPSIPIRYSWLTKAMKDSVAITFTGGRGSGKTLSMSAEAIIYASIYKKPVWANYPLFSKDKFVKANKLDIGDLISLKPGIEDGLILLDELNLWASNRGSGTIANRLLNAWLQLLRKRRLSLLMTTQVFWSLDKFIRYQTDIIVECNDLSYRYNNLLRGSKISQAVTDYSGYLTGRPLYKYDDWEAWTRNTRSRILSAMKYWGVYDTWQEYDILEANAKYEIERAVRVINQNGELVDKGSEQNELRNKIENFAQFIEYKYPNTNVFDANDLREMAKKDFGIQADSRVIGKILKEFGFSSRQTKRNGHYITIYEIERN